MSIDPITNPIITGMITNACYDVLQKTSFFVKDKVKESILKDIQKNSLCLPPIEILDPVIDKLSMLPIDEDSSVRKIEKEIEKDIELSELLKKIEEICVKPNTSISKSVNIQNAGSGSINLRDINQ